MSFFHHVNHVELTESMEAQRLLDKVPNFANRPVPDTDPFTQYLDEKYQKRLADATLLYHDAAVDIVNTERAIETQRYKEIVESMVSQLTKALDANAKRVKIQLEKMQPDERAFDLALQAFSQQLYTKRYPFTQQCYDKVSGFYLREVHDFIVTLQ